MGKSATLSAGYEYTKKMKMMEAQIIEYMGQRNVPLSGRRIAKNLKMRPKHVKRIIGNSEFTRRVRPQ